MHQDDFSVVLPSNSSMPFFPENTTTCFSTKLPREIELHEKWHVGLAEIHVPCTTLHLRYKDTRISSREEKEESHFQHGVYDSVVALIEAINDALWIYHDKHEHEKLFYDKKGGYVSFKEYTPDKKRSILMPAVKRILGFGSGAQVSLIPEKVDGVERNIKLMVAKQPATLAHAIPDQLFIYSNICEPCIVGDAYAPLLRIVSLEAKQYKYGSTIVKRYAPVSYIPLLNNRFQTIDIDIRDQFGNPVAFEFGTLTVTLHFKKGF